MIQYRRTYPNRKGVTLTHPDYPELRITEHPVTGQALYSHLMELWRNDNNLIKLPFPMLSIDTDAGKYEFVDGWKLTKDSVPNFVRAGFAQRDSEGNVKNMHSSLIFLGDYDKAMGLYIEADGIEYRPSLIEAITYPTHFDVNNIRNASTTMQLYVIFPTAKQIIIKNANNTKQYDLLKSQERESLNNYCISTPIIEDILSIEESLKIVIDKLDKIIENQERELDTPPQWTPPPVFGQFFECEHDWVYVDNSTAGSYRTCRKCNKCEPFDIPNIPPNIS